MRTTTQAGLPADGNLVPDFDMTYLRPDGSQWLATNRGGVVKYYFPYIRVI